ncbi:conjugal transfer protein TraN [Ruegeria jejuensis]|uniref:conjugal transfer protein TraN n=1 Tax=Ruegeria jejuensis TaxID=3233338 RepID=UPI00355B8207
MSVIRYFSLALFLTLSVGTSLKADINCQPAVYSCLEHGTSNAGGVQLASHCVREAGTQQCVDTDPVNECRSVSLSVKCTQLTEECIDYENGACRQTRFTYSCFNEDDDMSPAILTDTQFGPVQQTIVNTCTDYDNNPQCELRNTVTVEGAEVRTINRRDFFRNWWRREREYSCIVPGEGDNDCGPLESNPTCQLVGNSCMAEENGVCSNRQFHYQCGEEPGTLETSCEPINVCVGDNCIGVEQETSDDFGNSAAWLNILAQLQNEFRAQNTQDPNEVRFFVGSEMTCSDAPGRDCCGDGGILTNLAQCPQSAEILADKRQAGATHYIGVSCQEKVLGACIKKRHYFCTYNSKFGRVFIEEFKKQTNESWGDTNIPNCSFVTIEDIANVDVDQMDFSPVFGDIMADVQLPVSSGIQDFFNSHYPSADTDARQVYEDQTP